MAWLRSNVLASWWDRRRAFGELRKVEAVEAEWLSIQDSNPLHRAKVLLDAGDAKTAREFFDQASARMPDYVLRSPETVDVLLGLEDFAELESLMLKGAKRFPSDPHYLEGFALAAERRRSFQEATKRWAAVRKKFRYSKYGYVNAAGCLRQLGELDEAARIISRAVNLMPNDMTVLLEYCRIPEARDDWNEAYRRWKSITDRHPAGYMGAALALHRLDRTSEAEELLKEGRFRFPIEPGIVMVQARIAEGAGDLAEALKRWALARQRFPMEPQGYRESLRLLVARQEWDEADLIGQEAIRRFPNHLWPLREYANLARIRGDWAEASSRWAAVRAAYPTCDEAYRRGAEALSKSGQTEAAQRLLNEANKPAV